MGNQRKTILFVEDEAITALLKPAHLILMGIDLGPGILYLTEILYQRIDQ